MGQSIKGFKKAAKDDPEEDEAAEAKETGRPRPPTTRGAN